MSTRLRRYPVVLRLTAHFFFRFSLSFFAIAFQISWLCSCIFYILLVFRSSCYFVTPLIAATGLFFSDLDCIILRKHFFFKIISRVLYDLCHVTNESGE